METNSNQKWNATLHISPRNSFYLQVVMVNKPWKDLINESDE